MNNYSISNKSLEFQKKTFKEYYNALEIELPDRFGRREFGFVFFGGKGMLRHLSFDKKLNLIKFFKERIPAHAYYSTAYYKNPDASTMQEKNWMGAELIFDLDSDHLSNVENLSYSQQLDMVKKEFYKLVDDFLLNDFGFDEKKLDLYFSGSRGYHCHVKDRNILNLDSNERREIVDYITGRDIQDSLIFHEQVTGLRSYGGKNFPSGKSLKMPKPDDPGWRGRISKGIIEILQDIIKSEDPVKELEKYGVKKRDCDKLLGDLSIERLERIKEGNIDQSKTIRKFFLNSALRKTAVSIVAGETDEPVTCDIKRLIRLPSSLHGKTGFVVKKISLDDLKIFNPLIDAVILKEDPIRIELNKSFKIKMKGEYFNLKKGEEYLPTYLAFFLIGNKIANIV